MFEDKHEPYLKTYLCNVWRNDYTRFEDSFHHAKTHVYTMFENMDNEIVIPLGIKQSLDDWNYYSFGYETDTGKHESVFVSK